MMSLASPVFLLIYSMALYSAMNVGIRYLSADIASPILVFLRTCFTLCYLLAWTGWLQKGLPKFPTTRLKQHFMRTIISMAAMELWYYSIAVLPVTIVTALGFTTPIFASLIAIVFLGERMGMHRWSALVVSFIGMLVIVRPGVAGMSYESLFVLSSAALMAITLTLAKNFTRTEPVEVILFYMSLFILPWAGLIAAFNLQPVSGMQLGMIAGIALLSTASDLTLIYALKHMSMVAAAPFEFLCLLFTAIFAYFAFSEVIDLFTVSGSFLIVGSTVYISYREAQQKKNSPPDTLPGGLS